MTGALRSAPRRLMKGPELGALSPGNAREAPRPATSPRAATPHQKNGMCLSSWAFPGLRASGVQTFIGPPRGRARSSPAVAPQLLGGRERRAPVKRPASRPSRRCVGDRPRHPWIAVMAGLHRIECRGSQVSAGSAACAWILNGVLAPLVSRPQAAGTLGLGLASPPARPASPTAAEGHEPPQRTSATPLSIISIIMKNH